MQDFDCTHLRKLQAMIWEVSEGEILYGRPCPLPATHSDPYVEYRRLCIISCITNVHVH